MKLQIGQIDLSFHRVAAAVVLAYFDRIGQEYELHTAPHEKLFEQYRNGTVDMVLSAWLPSSHGKYIKDVTDETENFSVLYTPYCLWGVPDYVFEKGIKSVADVAQHHEDFIKIIQGINEGAGISRFSRNIIREYHLDQLGFEFKNGTIFDCTDAFVKAYEAKKAVIIPLWKPQYIFQSYDIKELKEPKGLLGSIDEATIILKKKAINKLNSKALSFIRAIQLGNDAVTKLDYQYQVEGKEPDKIAKEYIEQHLNY